MTALSCRQCGKAMERHGTGPAPTYCSNTCRMAARRGVSPAISPAKRPDVPEPTNDRGFAQRSSDAGTYGDGDRCPEGCLPGRMYVVGKERGADARQWCPNSRHPGNALYLYDGQTPLTSTSRSRPDPATETAARGGSVRASFEAPAGSADASIPRAELEPDGLGRGAVQMSLETATRA